jgi:hypothetical protein
MQEEKDLDYYELPNDGIHRTFNSALINNTTINIDSTTNNNDNEIIQKFLNTIQNDTKETKEENQSLNKKSLKEMTSNLSLLPNSDAPTERNLFQNKLYFDPNPASCYFSCSPTTNGFIVNLNRINPKMSNDFSYLSRNKIVNRRVVLRRNADMCQILSNNPMHIQMMTHSQPNLLTLNKNSHSDLETDQHSAHSSLDVDQRKKSSKSARNNDIK